MVSAGNLSRLGSGLAFALIMLSLVPLTGYGGQVSLCQMTFAGLGAFAMVKLGAGGSPLGLLAAAALAAGVGALIALPSLRLQGLYLALSTMAFAVLMDNMFFVDKHVFGYAGVAKVARPQILGLSLGGDRAFVVFLAVVFAALAVGVLALRRGPFGRVLAAMRDSEAACATLGLNLTATKLAVFTLSAAIAGLGGALFGGLRTSAGANDFIMVQSLPILLLVVIYGISTTSAALVGGLSLGLLPLVGDAFPVLAGVTFLGTGLAGVLLGSNPDGVLVGLYRKVGDVRASLLGTASHAPLPRPAPAREAASSPS
jgi:branched-chain amino acid transport system permease protein